ncbi:MAG: hypothetical protein ACI840_002020 [Ulvibacter sp.]|jgi:hypothetical protein
MNTLINEPLAKKKVLPEDYSICQNLATLKVVHNEYVNSNSDLNNVMDLFKGNADFISYGISAMTSPF